MAGKQGASELALALYTTHSSAPFENHGGQEGCSGVRLLGFIIHMHLGILVYKIRITVSTIPGVGVKIK